MAKDSTITLSERSARILKRELDQLRHQVRYLMKTQALRQFRMMPGGSPPLKRFELKTDLEPGGYAEAYDLVWDNETSDWQPDLEGKTKTVYDSTGYFRGRRRINGQSVDDTIRGFRGSCVKHADTGEWEIVYLEEGITMFSALVKAPRKVHPDDEYISIKDEDDDGNSLVMLWQSTDRAVWHTKNGKAPTRVRNPLGLSGNDGEHEGMIKMWWKRILDLPPDWKWMDGGENKRGSAISMISPWEKFPRGWQSSGQCVDEVLGEESHTHVISSNVTNIYADYTSGPDEIFTTFSSGDQVVHDPGHGHTAQSEEHIPPYQHLHFIEYEGDQRVVLVVWNDEFEEYCAVKVGVGIYWQLSESARAEVDKEDEEEDDALEDEEE